MKRIIQDLILGDEMVFKNLVKENQARVYHHVMQILRNREEAEDVCQETFIQVFESINDFKGESSLSTWIIRIAINKALMKLRKEKRRNQLLMLLPWWMPTEAKSLENKEFHPDILLENQEKAATLYKAIDSLSPNQRVAFTLIKIDERSYAEASELMNMSIKAIESLVSRAKDNVKKQLK